MMQRLSNASVEAQNRSKLERTAIFSQSRQSTRFDVRIGEGCLNACDKIFLVVGIIYLEKFLVKFCKNVLKILGKLFHADKWYFQPHGQNFVTKIWRTSTFLEGQIFSCKIFPQYLQKLMKGIVNSIEYCERPVSDQILIHEFPQRLLFCYSCVLPGMDGLLHPV